MTNFIAIALLLSLASCSESAKVENTEKNSEIYAWKTKNVDFNKFVRVEIDTVPTDIISLIQENYKTHPEDKAYDAINLFSAHKDRLHPKMILLFDIQYVEDLQVVYEVDDKGNIGDKYLLSSWN